MNHDPHPTDDHPSPLAPDAHAPADASHHRRHGHPSLLLRIARGKEASILEQLAHIRWFSILIVVLGPALGVAAFSLTHAVPPDQLALPGKVMLGIFVWAAVYWMTGAIPPFATALLVMGLCVFLIGLAPHDATPAITGWQQFVSPAAAPVVVLMLGGMVLGEAAHKHGIDRALARTLLKPFSTSPTRLLLGVVLVTALFSMWMSNTATAAMMVAMLAPVLTRLSPESRLRAALMMAVPVGANLGGIGTPIGTPPNALAFGAMREFAGAPSFLGWMLVAGPVTLVLLAIGWGVLLIAYRVDPREPMPAFDAPPPADWKRYTVAATFALTVVLWLTGAWTGIPAAPVAILPVVVFTATRLLDREDIKRLDWDVLLLVAGGLALGGGMEATGLAEWLIGLLPTDSLPEMVFIAAVATLTVVFSTLMSNTAVANLILPVAIGIAGARYAQLTGSPPAGILEPGAIDPASVDPETLAHASRFPMQVAYAVAMSASLAMALPVSTPPNAIAAGSGLVTTRDFLRVGVAVGALGLAVVLVTIAFV